MWTPTVVSGPLAARPFPSPLRPSCLLATLFLLPACRAGGADLSAAEDGDGAPRRPTPQVVREIEGEPLYRVLPRGAIPAIDEPRFVSAQEADAFLAPDETVLGVVGRDGTARCYSTWHLDRHEIVDDVLDGEPIAATW